MREIELMKKMFQFPVSWPIQYFSNNENTHSL